MDEATEQMVVRFTLDGRTVAVSVPAGETLLRTLRDRLGITSARGTCGIGVCGTCTVLADGAAVSSCIMLTAQAVGRSLTTAEGLCGPDGALSDVQQAFVDRGAYQCSFCIPAMALTVQAALDAHPDRSADEVREELAGNLCRCGTYPQIMEAVEAAIAARHGAREDI